MQRNVLFVKLLKMVLVEFMIIYNFVEGSRKVIFCVFLIMINFMLYEAVEEVSIL